ncbi:unnamed protein product [Cyprideis torosa]|uniref:TATA box-binding protein-like 1 n=1 Tax=Cyprideis torosa TaxID=163714 RepID=A0A7R8ZK68_9CRUS|nr:unnamed protein product [Cyprideis torosa]CAG0879634.1 unnamed protein product [Cyprideis torosa]
MKHLPASESDTFRNSTIGAEVVPEEDTKLAVQDEEQEEEDCPDINISITNVVCSCAVRCQIDLRDLALRGANVEFRKESGMVTMKLRNPSTTASIWASGKITVTGANSEEASRVAARKVARCLQKLQYRVRFCRFRIVNVLGTCSLPFAIRLTAFAERFRDCCSYEPEIHPGATYRLDHYQATVKIFSTGSLTITAPSVSFVQQAVEYVYPLVHEYQCPKDSNPTNLAKKRKLLESQKAAGEASSARLASASTNCFLSSTKRPLLDSGLVGRTRGLSEDDEEGGWSDCGNEEDFLM